MEPLAVVACSGCGAGLPVRAGERAVVCRFCGTSTALGNTAVRDARQGGAEVEATLAAGLEALRDALARVYAPNAGVMWTLVIVSFGFPLAAMALIVSGAVGCAGSQDIQQLLAAALFPLGFAFILSFLLIMQVVGTHIPRALAARRIKRLRAAFDLAPQAGGCPNCGGKCQIPGAAVSFDCVYCHTPLLAAAGMLVRWGEEAVQQSSGWRSEAKRITAAVEERLRRRFVPYAMAGFTGGIVLYGAAMYLVVTVLLPRLDMAPCAARIGLPLLLEAALIALLVLALRRHWLVLWSPPLLEDGLAAFERGDFASALRIWRALAGTGDAAAQSKLGSMYYQGHGVEKDPVQAHVWLSLAARNERFKASEALTGAARQMTSAQLAEARQLASDWRPGKQKNFNYLALGTSALPGQDSPPAYKVGDTGPAGGLVFYVGARQHSDGWRYLEAAPAEAGAGSLGARWSDGEELNVKTGMVLGTGKANTAAIIAVQGAGRYAANLCRDLTFGGFNDWFLPSMDELNLLYMNLHRKGLSGFEPRPYWSSTRDGAYACYLDFGSGDPGNGTTDYECRVRAVRAF